MSVDPVKRAMVSVGLSFLVGSSLCAASDRFEGDAILIGNGELRSFVEVGPDGETRTIGIRFTADSLDGLPGQQSDSVEEHFSFEPLWPRDVPQTAYTPLTWISVDWTPHGHEPPGVYDRPHFDIHFYIMPRDEVFAIRPGPCGLVHCEDHERAMIPLPEVHAPPAYVNVAAVVPMMGAHLIDVTAPELADPPEPFTHTFIYGAYDGRITFFEPMVTLEFMRAGIDACGVIRQPESWIEPGWYPNAYCVRHDDQSGDLMVSLEDFNRHE